MGFQTPQHKLKGSFRPPQHDKEMDRFAFNGVNGWWEHACEPHCGGNGSPTGSSDYHGSVVDGPGRTNIDLGLFRDFKLSRGTKLQFRMEATNALNIVNLMNPGTNLNASSTFGRIREARPMRQVQLGLRLTF